MIHLFELLFLFPEEAGHPIKKTSSLTAPISLVLRVAATCMSASEQSYPISRRRRGPSAFTIAICFALLQIGLEVSAAMTFYVVRRPRP